MTRRTDHIRSTAISLARAGKLTIHTLADNTHIEHRQAQRWIATLKAEHLIRPGPPQQTPNPGPGPTTWLLSDSCP